MKHLLAHRGQFKVVHSIIVALSVFMVDSHASWDRSNKGRIDEPVKQESGAFLLGSITQPHANIPSTVSGKFSYRMSIIGDRKTPDAASIGRLV